MLFILGRSFGRTDRGFVSSGGEKNGVIPECSFGILSFNRV